MYVKHFHVFLNIVSGHFYTNFKKALDGHNGSLFSHIPKNNTTLGPQFVKQLNRTVCQNFTPLLV